MAGNEVYGKLAILSRGLLVLIRFTFIAVLSVSNKSGLVHLARRLHEFGVRLVASGGTATKIRNEHIPVM